MKFGIYDVVEEYDANGLWKGYTVAATASEGKQGKLYLQKDGRENYKAKPVDDNSDKDLEI